MAFPAHATAFARRFGANFPIICAPMLGNSTPQLISAAANAGCIAFEGAGQQPKEVLLPRLQESKSLTEDLSRVGVNLFVPSGFHIDPKTWTTAQFHAVQDAAGRYDGCLKELTGSGAGADSQPTLGEHEKVLSRQVDAVIEAGIKLVSFHFGWPPDGEVAKLRAAGVTIIGNATSLEEAKELAKLGSDAIIAQGGEAGGHRGTFLDAENYREHSLVPVLALVKSIISSVDIPVIAAGGIMDGADIVTVLNAGASAVQIGTAFLSCPECNTNSMHREALLNFGAPGGTAADPVPLVVTKGYTGKPARGLRTARATWMDDIESLLPNCFNGLPAGRPLNAAALAARRSDAAYMWAGAGYARSRAMPAAALVEAFVAEAQSASSARL